jgi:hypothetical protein
MASKHRIIEWPENTMSVRTEKTTTKNGVDMTVSMSEIFWSIFKFE